MPSPPRILTAACFGLAATAGTVMTAPTAHSASSLCGPCYAYEGMRALQRTDLTTTAEQSI
ncbi:hypothetical protein [Streptomyces sp. 7N604]|uniref:hypothetical protein n=1 Tax=Streptomyces sp. 7N604 TaxID=3457415 RepID=UPI003FD5A28F